MNCPHSCHGPQIGGNSRRLREKYGVPPYGAPPTILTTSYLKIVEQTRKALHPQKLSISHIRTVHHAQVEVVVDAAAVRPADLAVLKDDVVKQFFPVQARGELQRLRGDRGARAEETREDVESLDTELA